MFVVTVKLAETGLREITPIEAETFLQAYPAQLEIAMDNNFFEFIETTKDIAKPENYELYYNTVRKFSLLRDIEAQGMDIQKWYGGENETEANARLNKFTIKDILNDIETAQSKLRSKYDVDFVRNKLGAGDDVEELLAEFDEIPAFGAFRSSPYLTALYMGICRGHLQMHSAGSGQGKSIYSVMDATYLSAGELWDEAKQDFVPNLNARGPALFIATEMDLRREIKPKFLASVSGVPTNTITQGKSTKAERERILYAGEVLKQSGMYLVDMPDFTSKSVEQKIHEYVDSKGVETVVFDYLQLNSPLGQEYKANSGGVPSREDLVIRGLATDLKAYAERYNVRLITSSQLNGNEKTMEFPDESCLSSAKSIKQKLDAGCIIMSLSDRPKEAKIVEPYIASMRKGVGNNRPPKPNIVTYIYKARHGIYGEQKLKIFSYFDRGLLRLTDYCVLDQYNKPVNIPIPKLEAEHG